MNIADLHSLWKEERFEEAMKLVRGLLESHRDCPYLLVRFSMLIRLTETDGLELEDAERALLRAHEVAPNNADALEELAHYYDAVDPDPQKARKYAEAYVRNVSEALQDMKDILNEA